LAPLTQHADWASCMTHFAGRRLFAVTTRGEQRHDTPAYQPGDAFVFGPESRGLPQPLLDTFPPAMRLRLPMQTESRSLNLANTAAIMLFEAWRQNGFAGGA